MDCWSDGKNSICDLPCVLLGQGWKGIKGLIQRTEDSWVRSKVQNHVAGDGWGKQNKQLAVAEIQNQGPQNTRWVKKSVPWVKLNDLVCLGPSMQVGQGGRLGGKWGLLFYNPLTHAENFWQRTSQKQVDEKLLVPLAKLWKHSSPSFRQCLELEIASKINLVVLFLASSMKMQ